MFLNSLGKKRRKKKRVSTTTFLVFGCCRLFATFALGSASCLQGRQPRIERSPLAMAKVGAEGEGTEMMPVGYSQCDRELPDSLEVLEVEHPSAVSPLESHQHKNGQKKLVLSRGQFYGVEENIRFDEKVSCGAILYRYLVYLRITLSGRLLFRRFYFLDVLDVHKYCTSGVVLTCL